MKDRIALSNLIRISGIVALAAELLLVGCSPTKASAADASPNGSGYAPSSQTDALAPRKPHKPRKTLAFSSTGTILNSGESSSGQIDALAPLRRRKGKKYAAFSSDATLLGWNDTSSRQIDVAAALAYGRTKSHGHKRI